jgi:hypothetical protein
MSLDLTNQDLFFSSFQFLAQFAIHNKKSSLNPKLKPSSEYLFC